MNGPMFSNENKLPIDQFITSCLVVCKDIYHINPTKIWVHPNTFPKIDQSKFGGLTFRSTASVQPHLVWIGA
jgi:hypothetical protein